MGKRSSGAGRPDCIGIPGRSDSGVDDRSRRTGGREPPGVAPAATARVDNRRLAPCPARLTPPGSRSRSRLALTRSVLASSTRAFAACCRATHSGQATATAARTARAATVNRCGCAGLFPWARFERSQGARGRAAATRQRAIAWRPWRRNGPSRWARSAIDLGRFCGSFCKQSRNGRDQHVRNIGRPLVQIVDRSRLGRTQAGQGIAASQRRPATENMPPHAAAGEKIARHGGRRALGDPLRSKRAAGIGHQVVVRYALMRADQPRRPGWGI